MSNLLLDSFKWSTLDNFISSFRQLGLNVRFVMYHGDTHQHHEDKDPDIEFTGTHEISRGIGFRDAPWLLNTSDLEGLSRYEGLYFDILSRHATSQANWSAGEMSEHYYLALNFWKYKLSKLNINSCIAYFMPHEPCSVSLFIISKHLKIPFVFIDGPMIAGRIRFFSCSFSERNLLIRSPDVESEGWVREILKTYGQNLKNDFDRTTPPEIKYVLDNISKTDANLNVAIVINLCRNIRFMFLEIVNRIVKKPSVILKIPPYIFHRVFPRGPIFYKSSNNSWSSNLAAFGRIDWFVFKLHKRFSLMLKKGRYRKLCSPMPISDPYIYFAAPLQPEASTTPAALWNSDIYLFLKPLLEAAPPLWKIVYKVSPLAFSDLATSSSYIDWQPNDFYQRLIETGRVKFVLESTPTLQLIEGAMGVACINGTVAIEAVYRGKRAITKAPMWYDGIDGIHLCNSREDLDNAFYLMKRGVMPNPNIEQLKFSHESVFEYKPQMHNNGQFIENEFSSDAVPQMSKKMKDILLRFDNINDRKWKI